MYKKGDIHIGNPETHGYSHPKLLGLKKTNDVYLATGSIGCNLYVIGYKQQVKELIKDLKAVLPELED